MSLNYAFLTLKNHPASILMLNNLLRAGFVPRHIIQEESDFALKKAKLYNGLFSSHNLKNVTELVANHNSAYRYSYEQGIQTTTVDNINNQQTRDILQNAQPSLIVLGNCRIIKPEIFTLASDGCINTHPGVLPNVKGAFPQVWSVLRNEPIGATCHLIDEAVDTGPLLARESSEVTEEDTFDDIVRKPIIVGARLINKVMKGYQQTGELHPAVQPKKTNDICHRLPTADDIQKAKDKVESKEYVHSLNDTRRLPSPV